MEWRTQLNGVPFFTLKISRLQIKHVKMFTLCLRFASLCYPAHDDVKVVSIVTNYVPSAHVVSSRSRYWELCHVALLLMN